MTQLMRTEYLNLSDNTVRGGFTGHGESLNDVEKYLLPLDQLRSSSLYGHGVAAGLRVTAKTGQPGVSVSTGTALDAAGRVIALLEGGLAVVDPNADPHQLDNIPTVPVSSEGLVLSTAGLSGALLLTVTWREVVTGNQLALLHAPWLRLVAVTGFQNSGEQVVLARVTLDAAGLVTGLAVGPRRAVAVAAERLELGAGHAASGPQLTVGRGAGAALRAREDGGMEVNLDLLDEDEDEPFPALSVHGSGRIGIGTAEPEAGLEIDNDSSERPALRLTSDDDTWGSGLQLDNVAGDGRTYGMYSDSDGLWHFADRTANADRLTIDDGGRIGIGLTAGATTQRIVHVEGSEIHCGGTSGGFSFANRSSGAFIDRPDNGERWVWYSHNGLAHLWSGTHGNILSISPKTEMGLALDVARRMRVRQGGDSSAGIWFFQDTPQADRAFVGMAGDNLVGFWGNTGAEWGLRMDTTNGHIGVGTEPHDSIRLFVSSPDQAIEAFSQNMAIHCFGEKAGIVATGGVMAAQFNGEVRVFGRLRKGDSTFMIDHPLDPANKYLSHSAVESPDMANVYNGNIVTDENGEATVALPDYFEALNRDYRYQLTPIGGVAQVGVIGEVQDNRFTIRADKPGITVSWQVTGIRQDAYANANRLVVEEDKPEAERDLYLYPEAHGEFAEKTIGAYR